MALTPYLSKLMIYHEAHQLSRDGFSITYISNHLGLNWRTVKKILSMPDDRQYEQHLQGLGDKNKVLEPYESFVKSRLELYRDTSAAQMHDWLKEHFTGFPAVSAKTVFNFVVAVRQKYQLPKTTSVRVYEMVPELPYGQQAQVDFGEYSLRNSQGKRVKVYFFLLVLARSRYKYVWFSSERFTAHTAIDAHERAFAFIQGIPDTVVYDQDRVFLVDENKGDLLLTEAFKVYRQERKRIYVNLRQRFADQRPLKLDKRRAPRRKNRGPFFIIRREPLAARLLAGNGGRRRFTARIGYRIGV